MTKLPAGWKELSLGEVCSFKYGASLPEAKRQVGPHAVYGSNGKVGRHSASLTNGPTVIIGRKGSIGKVWHSHQSCWPIDTTYFVDKTCTDTDTRWLSYVLASLQLAELNKSAAVPGLNRYDAYRQTLLVPPIIEQRRIAAILDQADALRAKRRLILKHMDELPSSLFMNLFGDALGVPASVPMQPLGALLLDKPQNGLYKPSTEYGSGTKILRIDAFYDGVITKLDRLQRLRLFEKEIHSYRLRPNDIVINRVNSIELLGKSAIVPDLEEDVVFESNMMRLTINANKAEPAFVVQALQMPNLKAQIARSAKRAVNQASINQQDVMNFEVPCPSLDQQRRYVRLVSTVGKNRALQARAAAATNTLFASLQHRAFRGEL